VHNAFQQKQNPQYQIIISTLHYIVACVIVYSTKGGNALNIQFKKGILELLVLSLLKQRDMYGYELVNKISENVSISEGTIYPLLRRLNKEGYFETYLKESSEGPPRKYYKLADSGIAAHQTLLKEWNTFLKDVSIILKESNDE